MAGLIGTATNDKDGLLGAGKQHRIFTVPSYTTDPNGATRFKVSKGTIFTIGFGAGGIGSSYAVVCASEEDNIRLTWKRLTNSGDELKIGYKDGYVYVQKKYGSSIPYVLQLVRGFVGNPEIVSDISGVTFVASYEAFGYNSLAELADGISSRGYEVLYQNSNPKDFNGCTFTGIYAFGGISASNGPVPNPYGTLIVFNSKFTGGYSVQLFFSKTGSFYFRLGSGDWVTVM